MTKNNIKSKSGFTIIEVVLVLAIAGLIFLMVFIAFPGLQRSQRDTQRRNDLANLTTRIIDYQTNNRNQIPTDWDDFQTRYFSEYVDPDGNAYKFVEKQANQGGTAELSSLVHLDVTDNKHPIYVYKGAICNGENIKHDDSPRKVAFLYVLESGEVYCGNN